MMNQFPLDATCFWSIASITLVFRSSLQLIVRNILKLLCILYLMKSLKLLVYIHIKMAMDAVKSLLRMALFGLTIDHSAMIVITIIKRCRSILASLIKRLKESSTRVDLDTKLGSLLIKRMLPLGLILILWINSSFPIIANMWACQIACGQCWFLRKY